MSMNTEIIIGTRESLRERMMLVWNLVNRGIQGGAVVVTLGRVSKTRDQEKKYHAMIGDIAKQVTFDFRADEETGVVTRLFGRERRKRYSVDVWKALLVDKFAQEKAAMGEELANPGETIQSLDGHREVTVRPSTRKFRKREAAEFIEFLYREGVDMGVNWSEPALAIYAEYREARVA